MIIFVSISILVNTIYIVFSFWLSLTVVSEACMLTRHLGTIDFFVNFFVMLLSALSFVCVTHMFIQTASLTPDNLETHAQ